MSAMTLAELESLRHALLTWRFKLSSRVGGGIETPDTLRVHRELLVRHRVVVADAAALLEVPAGE